MFGEYHCRVDRGRVFIPSKRRHHFKSGLELALDEERRFIAAHPCQDSGLLLDAKGRLTIPKALRDEIRIKDMVIIVVADHYLEIWNPLSWEQEKAQAQSEADKKYGSGKVPETQ